MSPEVKVTATGILVIDLIAAELKNVAAPGEVVFAPRGIKTRLGGHPANLSIDLVKLGVPGDEVVVIGAVGEDIHGEFVERTLRSYGVGTFLQKVRDVETSKNLILVVQGEDRRFHVDIGANIMLSPEYLREKSSHLLSQIFYVGATGWLGEVDNELPSILREAESRGQITFVDIIAPYRKPWSYLHPSLKHAHVLHGNDLEVSHLTGEEELENSAKVLNRMGVSLALITLGEKGLYARTNRWRVRMPAFKVDAVDPTGAGDAFSAAVIHYILQNRIMDLEDFSLDDAVDMLIYASAAGAVATTMEGTTTAVSRENVEKLLDSQADEIRRRTHAEKIP